MTLQNLISDLKESVAEGSVERRAAQSLVDGRVELPESFTNADRTEIEFKDFNWGDKSPTSLYHLGISAFPTLTLDEVQPVLDEMLQMSRGLQLEKGVADAKYEVFWTPEAFQEETRLPTFFSSEITVRSSAYSVDPTKVRIGFQGDRHNVEASMAANQLTLKAEGNYRRELGNLIEALNPQFAKLKLSKDDAQRLLRKVNGSSSEKYFAQSLEKALQPEEQSTMSIGLGGMSFGTQEVIEIALRTKHLEYVKEAIGKPLLNVSGKDETGVTELIKVYNAIDLMRGRRLSDLQYIAGAVPKMELGMVYNHPVITTSQAQELLDAEIDIISKGYESVFGLCMNSHMWRGGVVKRLARDHFGDSVIEQFDETGVDDYVSLLKSQGYESIETFENEPEYIAKERHLLSFFRQSYDKDHGQSVEKFREFYQNGEPNLSIHARTRGLDASKTKKIKLPSKSRLFSFGITEHMHKATPYSNDMSITRTLPDSKDVHFWCRASVDSPILLPMQEYACREMGILFK